MKPEGTDQTPRWKEGWTVECPVRFERATNGRKRLQTANSPLPSPPLTPGRVPRVARLLALAHRFEALLRSGEVKNHADLARIGGVSRPRVTQILSFLLLAPAIQEAILDLPLVHRGRDPLAERDLRSIVRAPEWPRQLRLWNELRGTGI